MRSRSERAKVSSLNEQLYAMGYKILMLVTFYKVYAKSQVWEKSSVRTVKLVTKTAAVCQLHLFGPTIQFEF